MEIKSTQNIFFHCERYFYFHSLILHQIVNPLLLRDCLGFFGVNFEMFRQNVFIAEFLFTNVTMELLFFSVNSKM